MFVCKTICQGEDGRMKAGCQLGLRNTFALGQKGSWVCVSTKGDGQLCSCSCHIKHFNLWHCLFQAASLSSSLLSFFPLLPCSPAFPGAWVFCCLADFTLRDPGTCLQHHRVDTVSWDPWDMGLICCSSGASLYRLSPESWI